MLNWLSVHNKTMNIKVSVWVFFYILFIRNPQNITMTSKEKVQALQLNKVHTPLRINYSYAKNIQSSRNITP